MIRRGVLAAVLAVLATTAAAQEFAVHTLWFQQSARGHSLHANLSAGPESLIRQLLHGGYAVKLRFDLRLIKERDWLPDRELGDIVWQPVIYYDSLLNRYTFNIGEKTEEYDTLAAALKRAERLRAVPASSPQLARMLLLPELYLMARYEMEIEHLPQTLQVSLLTGDWRIDSGWRRFAVEVRK